MASLPHQNHTLEECWAQGLDNFAQLENNKFVWGGFFPGIEVLHYHASFSPLLHTGHVGEGRKLIALCTSDSCYTWEKSTGQTNWSVSEAKTGLETATYDVFQGTVLYALEVESDSEQVVYISSTT